MLAEFKQSADFWNKTDSRLEGTIRLYLTLATIVLSGFIFLSKDIFGKSYFWHVAFIVSIIFLLGGLISMRRIITTSLLKTEYLISINLIRKYFADRNPELIKYLFLPIGLGEGDNSTSKIHRRFKAAIPSGIILMMQFLCAGLSGLSVFLLIFIVQNKTNYTFPTIFAVIAIVAVFLLLQVLRNRIYKNFIKGFESRLKNKL